MLNIICNTVQLLKTFWRAQPSIKFQLVCMPFHSNDSSLSFTRENGPETLEHHQSPIKVGCGIAHVLFKMFQMPPARDEEPGVELAEL